MAKVRVIDFETTGEEPPAEVCEVGYCDIEIDQGEVTVSDPQSYLCSVHAMPPEVRAVHQITFEQCSHCHPFDPDLFMAPDIDVIAAHNASYELKFFDPELPIICTYKAALRIWPDAPSHKNGALLYWLEDAGKLAGFNPALAMPFHRAGPDAYATAYVLKAMLAEGYTGKEMVAWTREPSLFPRCPIGKYRGERWADIDSGYLEWMIGTADMDEDLKWNARREIDKRRSWGA